MSELKFVEFENFDIPPGIFTSYMEIMQEVEGYDHNWYDIAKDLLLQNCVFFRFQYFVDVEQEITSTPWINLSNIDKSKKVVIDLNQEGYSFDDAPIIKNLHYNCLQQNFPSNNLYYITGNLLDFELYEKWCEKNNFMKARERINVIPVCSWDTERYLINKSDEKDYIERRLNKIQYVDKYFIYLSRRVRDYRTLLTYSLLENQLDNKAILSHDKITNEKFNTLNDMLKNNNRPEFIFKYMSRFPIVADHPNFGINWAFHISENIHLRAFFSVVGETYQEDWNKTSMFFSEKTFRPMLLGQPFFIWGQHECHKWLHGKLGYKPYSHFDYSFDDIENNVDRCFEIVKQLESITNLLKGMTKNQRIDWALQDMDTVYYNRNRLQYNKFSYNNFKSMFDEIVLL